MKNTNSTTDQNLGIQIIFLVLALLVAIFMKSELESGVFYLSHLVGLDGWVLAHTNAAITLTFGSMVVLVVQVLGRVTLPKFTKFRS